MPRLSETTQDGIAASEPAPGLDGTPSLLLALCEQGQRPIERCSLTSRCLVIGRETSPFPGGPIEDRLLSRRHAEVKREDDHFVLRDLGSRNGTFLNGQRVRAALPLLPGAVIRVGSTLLIFAPATAERSPPEMGPTLVGDSARLAVVRRSLAFVAGQGRSVLLTGETGTGKDLAAQVLHARSGRGGPFIAVNCGTFTDGTLASELFGHLRGAFTGAASDRVGLFRAAHGGTLFLDEIGDLPLPMQVMLLRAIDTGRVRPVGGVEEVEVDVAVVAATHRDLAVEAAAGRFRPDLFARLAQWLIHMPPLRERNDDVPWLWRALLSRLGAEGRRLTPRFAEALLLHPWPLNVRGLLNVLSVATLVCPPDSALDLVPEVTVALHAARAGMAPEPYPSSLPTAPPPELLAQVLRGCGGKVSAAAREIGCSRQQLYRWIEKSGLILEAFRQPPT